MTAVVRTREEWLRVAIGHLSLVLAEQGEIMPDKWNVSAGWPYLTGRKAIAECWSPVVSAEGVTEIFVSPELSDPVEILPVLLHEMIHAAIGVDKKHGPEFKRVARGLGLEGKLTSTHAGPALAERLADIAVLLGPYPHAAMRKVELKKAADKVGYWPTYISPVDPNYRVQVRTKSLEEYGPPVCPISGETMIRSAGRGK